MIFKEKDGFQWLQFDLLSQFQEISHGSFFGLAQTGEEWRRQDFGSTVSRLEERTQELIHRVSEALRLPHLLAPSQSHGTKIATVPEESSLANCDGLITNHPQVGLMIRHADCQAAIFYDPCHRVIANIHCGWRGNVQNIYRETIGLMQDRYETRPEDLIVCISPSLGPDSSEFINYKEEFPKEFWNFQAKPFYFNLWEISRWQLMREGVLRKNIEIASLDTYSNSQFFSYRKEKNCGRMATIVGFL